MSMAIEQRHIEMYRDLFVHREDVFARQTPNGSYFLRRARVSDKVLGAHLLGDITAGFYALRPDNTTRWVVLDADRPDGLAQLQEGWRQLDTQGIPSQLEASRRGGHLWIFFEPIQAINARRLVLAALPDLEGLEIYPKQDHVREHGVGSLVRGPLGIHRLTGKRHPFLDHISLHPTAATVQSTLEYLQEVPRLTEARVLDLLERLPPPALAERLHEARLRERPQRLTPIDQLKQRIGDQHAFIAQFVELDAKGRGHCPLHPPDAKKSFAVDPQTGHWTCFHEVDPRTGTYLGGDAIEFYRRLKGLSYKDVMRELRQVFS